MREKTEMLIVSMLRRFELIDAKGGRARLTDLAIDLLQEDYPPVTHLVFNEMKKGIQALSWDTVVEFNLQRRRLVVVDIKGAQPAETILKQETLLCRDILDALVLDLDNRRVTRANDLYLKVDGRRLLLQAADVSAHAVLRRLTRGVFGRKPGKILYDWKHVEFLRGNPQEVRSGAGYRLRITRMPPGEIARLSEAVSYLHATELVKLLPDPLATDTLELMSPERQLQVFEEFDEGEAVKLLGQMAPDIAADLVRRLHIKEARRLLELIPTGKSKRIIDLLRYPEHTVGGVMTNDLVEASAEWTVAEARDRLRERIKEHDSVYFIYVLDHEESGRLSGILTMRDLIVADEDRPLSKVMNSFFATLDPLESATEGAYRVIESHLAALPVVAQDGRLLGAVTSDIAILQVAPPNLRGQLRRVFS
jgi:magnesium transporter